MKKMNKLFFTSMLLLFANYMFAQTVVKGVVKEEGSNEPLFGVTIMVEGSSEGSTTDLDGSYSLKIEDTKGKNLMFTYIGYETLKVSLIGSNQTINVSLKPTSTMLDEVVVTALGIKREQKALGYSLTQVGGDDITKGNTTSAVNALQGKVAGVNISTNSSGAAGSSRVIIRGASSLTGNNQPLYVIDGIPIMNKTNGSVVGPFGGEHGDGGDDISSINPNDIASISVLKGSSAAALYGSMASNGVIMITTKTGKGNKSLGVEFSNKISFNKVNTSLLNFQTKYGQGRQGLKPGFEFDGTGTIVAIADSDAAIANTKENSFSSWGAAYDGSKVLAWDGSMQPYNYDHHNIEKFYNTGTNLSTSIALAKGGDNYNYRFSFTNLNNKDIFPNTTLNRKSFAVNASATINPKLISSINATYTIEKVHNRVTIGDTPGNANTTAWLLPGNVDIYRLKPGSNENGTELLNDNSQWITNPYWATNNFNNNDNKNRLFATTNLKFNITDWLYATGRVGIDTYVLNRKQVTPYGTEYRPAGVLTQSSLTNTLISSDVMLGFDKDITEKIGINAFIGGSSLSSVYKGLSAKGSNFIVPEVEDLGLTTSPKPTNIYRNKETNSLYGSFEANYNQFAYLTFTGRNDWFSTLSYPGKTTPNNEFYWSLSNSLLLNKIFEMPDAIDYLKLRGSYAQVAGGADTPYYLNLNYAILDSFGGQPYGQINGNVIPNSVLVPFQKNEFEIGLDSRFFGNRLFVDAAYYSNKTTKDIVFASASIPSGFTSAILNVGELSNKGVELLIGGTPVKNDNITWETSFNIGYNNSEILSTDELETPINVDGSSSRTKTAIISHIVGEHYGVIYGSTFVRDSVNGTGKIYYDMSGSIPKPIQGEFDILGQGVAPLNLGFHNSVNYKDFSLSFLIDGKFGGSVHSGTNLALMKAGLHEDTLEGREGGLEVTGIDAATGDEFTMTVPVKDLENYYGNISAENLGISEAFIYSTDFIKFREVSLSYNLPDSLLDRIFLKNIQLSFVGRDLFYIMKKVDNIDPEASLNNMNSQGIERFGMPATRSLGFSVNVKF